MILAAGNSTSSPTGSSCRPQRHCLRSRLLKLVASILLLSLFYGHVPHSFPTASAFAPDSRTTRTSARKNVSRLPEDRSSIGDVYGLFLAESLLGLSAKPERESTGAAVQRDDHKDDSRRFGETGLGRRTLLRRVAALPVALMLLVRQPPQVVATTAIEEIASTYANNDEREGGQQEQREVSKSPEESGMVSADRVGDLLRAVPTFTIVDERGVPFMVVGEDAKVTGYFFTEYSEAKRILDLARDSADKAIEEGKKDPSQTDEMENPWTNGRISSVPMDFAVTVVTKSGFSSRRGGNYFYVAPSEDDIDDALAITKKKDLAEGRVPLFYFENFTITDDKNNKQSPLYFRKSELIDAFKEANPKATKLPKIRVTEMFAVLTEMVKPGGKDEDLKTLVFVPPAESLEKAKECQRKGGQELPFLLGERNLIL